MSRITTFAAGLAGAAATALAACAQEEERGFVFEGRPWTTNAEGAAVTTYLGREALSLNRAAAWPDDAMIGDGVLEYDFAAPALSGFVGVSWRMVDAQNSERFYARLQQTGQADATQYMPIFNGIGAWQLHAGPNDAVAVDYAPDTWIHVKIVAEGDRADIYVGDAETPTIHAPRLRRTPATGGVQFFASDLPGRNTGAYLSNVSVRPLAEGEHVVGAPAEEPPLPDGVIETWSVSSPFAEAEVADATSLDGVDADALDWTVLDAETNGVANLAKVATRAEGADTVLVKTTIMADAATTRMLAFGYSDRVRLYLNGELLFAGDAGWRVRDHRFLGTVGWHDAAALKLRAGENTLVAAVSETFGGWGFTGAIADQSGLMIAP